MFAQLSHRVVAIYMYCALASSTVSCLNHVVTRSSRCDYQAQTLKPLHFVLSRADRRFKCLACSELNIWAVDDRGRVHMRIGVDFQEGHLMNAAWVRVDGMPVTSGAKFVKVATGFKDWMVGVGEH